MKKKRRLRRWRAWAVVTEDVGLTFEYDPGTSRHGKWSVYVSPESALKAAYGNKDSVVPVEIRELPRKRTPNKPEEAK